MPNDDLCSGLTRCCQVRLASRCLRYCWSYLSRLGSWSTSRWSGSAPLAPRWSLTCQMAYWGSFLWHLFDFVLWNGSYLILIPLIWFLSDVAFCDNAFDCLLVCQSLVVCYPLASVEAWGRWNCACWRATRRFYSSFQLRLRALEILNGNECFLITEASRKFC